VHADGQGAAGGWRKWDPADAEEMRSGAGVGDLELGKVGALGEEVFWGVPWGSTASHKPQLAMMARHTIENTETSENPTSALPLSIGCTVEDDDEIYQTEIIFYMIT